MTHKYEKYGQKKKLKGDNFFFGFFFFGIYTNEKNNKDKIKCRKKIWT